MHRGKIYLSRLKAVDRKVQYPIGEAVRMLKETPSCKFDETVEIAMRLGVDPRHADQIVRGTVLLPYGTGRQVRVLVLTKGELEVEARDAGADYVGADDYIQKISEGWVDFDVAIASPDMMGSVGKLGRILGPRGLMPNPKSGTVTRDVGRAVREAKAGRIEFRVDRGGNVHAPVGKISFENDYLIENAKAFVDVILRAKPSASKGQYVRSATLCSTMGPGIRLDRSLLA